MKGPFPIVCRGHSGSRVLSEAFRRNRIWMGIAENPQRDSYEFRQGHPTVRFLLQAGVSYGSLSDERRAQLQTLMRELVDESRTNCPDPEDRLAYGWKRPIMVFACEIFMDAYPEGRIVHLIRDGRDAMLSRLDSRMENLNNPLHRMVVFGDPSLSEYRGLPLNQAVQEFRNEIEMHHWLTAVRAGMRARKYGKRYLEVRYEDLCTDPDGTLQTVFDFLGLPFLDESREWARANVSTRSIGKWKGREEELADAIRIGEPLLRELGYA